MEVYDKRELLVWRDRVGDQKSDEGTGGGVERDVLGEDWLVGAGIGGG